MEYTCKDGIEMLSDVATVIIAGIALYYAWRTYGVAKEAKDEWKNEKNLDILVRFSKVFPSSKELIVDLRNPYSFDFEHKKGIKLLKERGNHLNEEYQETHSEFIKIQYRYLKYESYVNELFNMEYEALFVLGENNAITKYIRFIKKTKEDIFDSALKIGYYKSFNNSDKLTKEEHLQKSKLIREHRKIIFSIGDDQISNDLHNYYSDCESFLKSHQARFKIT
ncbi:hypothetical protein [Sphingobacterium sp. R2]|uniref:hypothetical protein n=1 Tax=Sphingobacterium sp. R2 TaxID=3112958 RepID=UPI00345CDDAC